MICTRELLDMLDIGQSESLWSYSVNDTVAQGPIALRRRGGDGGVVEMDALRRESRYSISRIV